MSDIELLEQAPLDETFGAFFAPCSTDLVDGLIAEYRKILQSINTVSDFINNSSDYRTAVDFFIEGNKGEQSSRHSTELSCARLFERTGAVAALTSHMWSKALSLTDVLDCMPEARRQEWFEQLRNPAGKKKDWSTVRRERDLYPERFNSDGECIDPANAYELPPLPEFDEGTVRSTLAGLLNSRAQFMAERVDGIFRNLSGEHVTNTPSGFGKRMIMYYVTSYHNDRTGYINDLRCVIAKLQQREEPRHYVTHEVIRRIKQAPGIWHELDGGAVRMRVYMKGTAHLEVHPEMAWQLNRILAFLYPAAIPSEFRMPPKMRPKEIKLMQRPLPDSVIGILSGMKPASEKVPNAWPERRRSIPNTYSVSAGDADKFALAEAHRVLEALGGTPLKNGYFFQFDYDPGEILTDVVISGCIPDHKSHQFYPTPARLAQLAVGLADIGPGHHVIEPSAGQGGLAEFLPKDRTVCVEISALQCQILEAKGFATVRADFLNWAAGQAQVDRVVMNPPFSDGRWQAHLAAAADLVKPGGKLVAILPQGAANKNLLPGWAIQFSRAYDGEFAGASVSVVILSAAKPGR